MCDHCGCRAVAPVRELMAEHDRLRALADDVRRAVQRQDRLGAQEAFADLRELLLPHVAAEEAGLFEVLRQSGDFVDHVDVLEQWDVVQEEGDRARSTCGPATAAAGGRAVGRSG